MHKKAKAGEWTGRGTGPMMEGSHPFFKCSYNCSSCFDPLPFVTWHDLLLGPYSLHPSTRPHTAGHIRRVAGTARGARRHHPGPHARQGLDRGAESGEFAGCFLSQHNEPPPALSLLSSVPSLRPTSQHAFPLVPCRS